MYNFVVGLGWGYKRGLGLYPGELMTGIKKDSMEAPPGVSGNKGTWPLTFWEHRNKRIIKLGTQEQKRI